MNEFQWYLFQVLLQLTCIIAAARLGGALAKFVGQPEVVGEIAAGLMIGPSLLGQIWPSGLQVLFDEQTGDTMHVISELGLILLMFLVGLEFDFRLLRGVGGTAAGVALTGLLLPLALGMAAAVWIHPQVAADIDRTSFALIIGVAMSITAIPILGRIMIDLNLQRTPLGVLTITAAAIDDAAGWILLAAVTAGIGGAFDPWSMFRMVALLVGFVAVCVTISRVVLGRMGTRPVDGGSAPAATLTQFTIVFAAIFLAAMATSLIGVFAVFGPFVLGASLSDRDWFHRAIAGPMRPIVYSLLLPVFFTHTGLRTDVGSLQSAGDWGVLALLFLVAVGGKCCGCYAVARLGGWSRAESGCVAAMMNTRALMGLIAINVGRDLGVVPDRVFTSLVLIALATTVMTMPILRRLLPRVADGPGAAGRPDRNGSHRSPA